ncbi:hypothetical protein HDU96_004222 [Phlyctochytrium bullatum]|nr:hypothetical protein HDU96_004222 [Phlyctochytrium bullatum]
MNQQAHGKAPVVIVGPVKITSKVDRSANSGGSATASSLEYLISSLQAFGGGILTNPGGGFTGWLPLFADDEVDTCLESLGLQITEIEGSGETEVSTSGTFKRGRALSILKKRNGYEPRHGMPRTGSSLTRSGRFTLVLDNSHSMYLSKTITVNAGIRSIRVSPNVVKASNTVSMADVDTASFTDALPIALSSSLGSQPSAVWSDSSSLTDHGETDTEDGGGSVDPVGARAASAPAASSGFRVPLRSGTFEEQQEERKRHMLLEMQGFGAVRSGDESELTAESESEYHYAPDPGVTNVE